MAFEDIQVDFLQFIISNEQMEDDLAFIYFNTFNVDLLCLIFNST
jgi:hypothetical protein